MWSGRLQCKSNKYSSRALHPSNLAEKDSVNPLIFLPVLNFLDFCRSGIFLKINHSKNLSINKKRKSQKKYYCKIVYCRQCVKFYSAIKQCFQKKTSVPKPCLFQEWLLILEIFFLILISPVTLKIDQGHKKLIIFSCEFDENQLVHESVQTSLVWSKIDILMSPVILKIGSRSPKSNHLSDPS